MMAPDSQRVMPVFGSSMAGTPKAYSVTQVNIFEEHNVPTAVNIDVDEWLLLQDGHIHEFSLVGNTQLLENDGNLPWVGTLVLL